MPLTFLPTVRAASLRGLERLARDFKVDEAALMRELGLSPQVLRDPEARISVAAGCDLLEAFAIRSGREDVGLLLAQDRRLSDLGSLGLHTALQADLRHALQVLVARRREVNSGLALSLEEFDGIGVLRLDYVVTGAIYARQATEQTMGALVQVMRQFLGHTWNPRRVCFRHPPPANLRTHRKVLGWAVEFEHDFNAIVLTTQELDKSAPLQDPALADLALKSTAVRTESVSLAQACREHLSDLLPQGAPSIDQIAFRMGMPRRTLQRHLQDEGQTFSELLQALRVDLLQNRFAGSRRPFSEVATLLGFSAHSAFSRWHKATFGTTPRDHPSSGRP